MREIIQELFKESIAVQEACLNENVDQIAQAAQCLIDAIEKGNKVLIFGNGGSAADSQHMAAELVGRFQEERQAFAAVALTTDTSSLTALGNDYGFEKIFARQIEALGQEGDVALAISTSGNSANVMAAVDQAKTLGMTVIGLTGGQGGQLVGSVDIALVVPSDNTARIQESHACIIHCLCELVETRLQG